MPFESELVAEQEEDFHWRLTAPLIYRGNTDSFTVPAGTRTDWASIPKVFQWLLPRSGRYTKAAVLHDYLWSKPGLSRRDADGLFRRAMAELGVPFLRRWLMWAAVRLASLWKSWFRDGPRDLPWVAVVFVYPGVFVVLGGIVVGALLAVFYVLEGFACGALWALRQMGMHGQIKPVNPPRLY